MDLVGVTCVDEPDVIRADYVNSLWALDLSGEVVVDCYVLVCEATP